MIDIKLSCYLYAFNCTLRDFDLDGAISNFTAFFDEVVIATVPSQDDTYARLIAHEMLNPKVRVILTDINPSKNNRFDGDLKTAAMKACAKDNLLVIADMDERFLVEQRPLWDKLGQRLLDMPNLDGLMIPVVDLWGSVDTIRADQPIGQKFRMHKHTVVKRGVPTYAERADGLIATSMSDTTEPLNRMGQVASFASIIQNPITLQPKMCQGLEAYPYVVHYGFLDLDRRAKIGREFWKQAWEARSGKREDVAVDKRQLEGYPLVRHNLRLT